MCGEAEANKLKAIPLSNNTVKRRIEAIAANQENTLVERLKNTDAYALQVDMSTEGRDAHFLCFVRYIWEGAILEDILFCLPLPGHETAQEIFNVLHGYLKDNYIPFDRMVGFCTDGAPSVAGHRAGLRALVKIIAPSAAWTHCMIHREQLAAKDLSTELGEVLQQVTCIVNYIKAHPLRARLFAKLCEDMGSDHNLLLFHTEVRWLSRGRILERFFKLKEELLAYAIVCKKTEFSNVLSEQTKMCLLAYVTDIFGKLNELNTGMQGKNTNIFQLSDRITAFMKKITFWKTRLLQSNYESFPHRCKFLSDNDNVQPFPHLCKFLADNDNVQPPTQVIAEHLSRLNGQFASFFPDLDMSKYDWLQNPFQCNPDTVDLPAAEIEQLIEISCDRQLQGTYAQLTLSEFWFSVKNEYPALSTRAMTLLVPFATTYLCEAGFSALVCIKSRYRSTLDVTSEIRCAISTTPPDFDKLCDNIQAHASH
ncbi:UNVERIFIED_CONTAM: hypothetical protein FKN15_055997 [Acipenser sinensis]